MVPTGGGGAGGIREGERGLGGGCRGGGRAGAGAWEDSIQRHRARLVLGGNGRGDRFICCTMKRKCLEQAILSFWSAKEYFCHNEWGL